MVVTIVNRTVMFNVYGLSGVVTTSLGNQADRYFRDVAAPGIEDDETNRFLRSSAAVPSGRYRTPQKAPAESAQ